MKLKPIHEQVVVIVGASSGIGRDAALRFAERGAQVVLAARSEAGLQTLAKEIQERGGEAIWITADVADFNQVQAIAEAALRAYGRIDTWVHLAAVSVYAPFDQLTPEEFRRVIEVNLLGQVYGAMVALPHLKREGRGALIHVTSILGKRAIPLQSPYDASKFGVTGMLDALRVELKHAGWPISVTNILPASMNTPLFNKARTKLGVKPAPYPPIYAPQLTTQAILFAAEHPRREIVVGGAGKLMIIGERLWPPLIDLQFLLTAFKAQRSDDPKSPEAPSALFEPIPYYNRVEGDFTAQARRWSLYTWLQTTPGLKYILLGGVLGGGLALGLIGQSSLHFLKRRLVLRIARYAVGYLATTILGRTHPLIRFIRYRNRYWF